MVTVMGGARSSAALGPALTGMTSRPAGATLDWAKATKLVINLSERMKLRVKEHQT